MGATFIVLSHEGDRKSMKSAFAERVDSDSYRYGNNYSGSFSEFSGLEITGNAFDSDHEAEEWLMDNTNKWDVAKAVTFKSRAKLYWLVGGWASS